MHVVEKYARDFYKETMKFGISVKYDKVMTLYNASFAYICDKC